MAREDQLLWGRGGLPNNLTVEKTSKISSSKEGKKAVHCGRETSFGRERDVSTAQD